jgi:hypothetical protein
MQFGPATPAIEWLQTHALDCTATGIGIPCIMCAYYTVYSCAMQSELLCNFILTYPGLIITKGHGAELPALFKSLFIHSLSAYIRIRKN